MRTKKCTGSGANKNQNPVIFIYRVIRLRPKPRVVPVATKIGQGFQKEMNRKQMMTYRNGNRKSHGPHLESMKQLQANMLIDTLHNKYIN